MKTGYYISAYVEISKTANILFESNRHDHGIALWKYDGQEILLVHYWELERLTGIKQHRIAFSSEKQFHQLLSELLSQYDLGIEDIVEIWGLQNHCYNRFTDYTFHCMCHLYSNVLSETNIFFEHPILAFVLDGGSDLIGDVRENQLHTGGYQYCSAYFNKKAGIESIRPSYSPAVLWNIASMYFDMREGSLMALANASESRLLFEPEQLLIGQHVTKDMEKYEKLIDFFQKVEQLTEKDEGILYTELDPRFSERENKISMIMKAIQKMSQDIMVQAVENAIHEYQIKPEETYLSMSGGFALNCPCNTYLMKKYPFKGFYSIPCVSDSGMALGIGLYTFYNELGNAFRFTLDGAYHGDQFDAREILKKTEFKNFIQETNEYDPAVVAEDMIEEPIIWFNGKSEIGPRALGNRSILGDPRSLKTKDILNEIKQRQWWRPVAPIILYDYMDDWFEDKMESPYMLQAIKVKTEKQNQVQAIVHMDGTARVQTLAHDSNMPMLEEVLQKFYQKTGVPIICNTSLNDKGEPIINTMEEAMNFALRKGIHRIYLNGIRVTLKNHSDYPFHSPLRREKINYFTDDESNYWNRLKEKEINEEELHRIYFFHKLMDDDLDQQNQQQWHKEMIKNKYVLNNFRFVRMEYEFMKKVSNSIKSILEKEK